MMDSKVKKTPLFNEHVRLGGKMTNFVGWMMPLWYPSGQSIEHHTARKTCGIFDTCHMGEFEIKGQNSELFLSWILTNNVLKMDDGKAMYNFLLNENGGVVDDCILYRFSSEHWMLVVNAGNIEDDFEWIRKHAPSDIELTNITYATIKIDLQGPNSPKLMSRWIDREILSLLKFFRFLPEVKVDGMSICISRTGYTGEIGFEFYTDLKNGVDLWNLILSEGKKYNILPCGLGARDTLRTEAGLPLHGHELKLDWVALGHPWEFAISWDHEFLGKEALTQQKEMGINFHVLPFIMEGRRKAMPGWKVFLNKECIGTVLSGVISPTMNNTPIGFMKINRVLESGTRLLFREEGRDGFLNGMVGEIPFIPLTSRKRIRDFL